MTRPLRHLVEDGWYHVFGRGWERRRIFRDDRDREHFLELLCGLTEQYRFVIHAYALMDNHHHLIVQTPEGNLSAGMQWFNTSYSAWFNARHQRVGSLWQGRYRDVLVENSAWAYELSVYIHLNPLRISGMGLGKSGRMMEGRGYRQPTREEVTERLGRLREYRWSSYRAYAGYEKPATWLTTEVLLSRAGPDAKARASGYRTYIRERLTQGVEPTRQEQLRDVIAIGSTSFAQHVRRVAGQADPEVTHRRELRKYAREETVRKAVEEISGKMLKEFTLDRRDWGRGLYLWAVRRYCGLTLREAGAAVGGLKPTAVAMAIKRWEQKVSDSPDLQEQQQKLEARIIKT